MSFVPFSITSPGGNSKGLLLIFSPFSDLIKPAIINEKYGECVKCQQLKLIFFIYKSKLQLLTIIKYANSKC
jgi:hypothetical protein